jgi:hypothetical protein
VRIRQFNAPAAGEQGRGGGNDVAMSQIVPQGTSLGLRGIYGMYHYGIMAFLEKWKFTYCERLELP